mgnify:CR=1 FL=1
MLTLDKTTTGDAIVVALQVLAAMKRTGKTLKDLASGMQKTPQVHNNVRLTEKFDPNSSEVVMSEVESVTKELGTSGRVVLRASGTEPLVRIMVEAEEEETAQKYAEQLAEVVRNAAA